MQLGKQISGGYAAATTGGVSWMFDVEVTEGRFDSLEENEKYVLNVVVLCEKELPITATMCSSSTDEAGNVSNWGLDRDNENNRIIQDELNSIRQQLESNGLLQKSQDVMAEYNRLSDELFNLPSLDLETIRANRKGMSEEEKTEDVERVFNLMEDIREKQKNLFNQMENLRIFT